MLPLGSFSQTKAGFNFLTYSGKTDSPLLYPPPFTSLISGHIHHHQENKHSHTSVCEFNPFQGFVHTKTLVNQLKSIEIHKFLYSLLIHPTPYIYLKIVLHILSRNNLILQTNTSDNIKKSMCYCCYRDSHNR